MDPAEIWLPWEGRGGRRPGGSSLPHLLPPCLRHVGGGAFHDKVVEGAAVVAQLLGLHLRQPDGAGRGGRDGEREQ